jgi:hypothetical protein
MNLIKNLQTIRQSPLEFTVGLVSMQLHPNIHFFRKTNRVEAICNGLYDDSFSQILSAVPEI